MLPNVWPIRRQLFAIGVGAVVLSIALHLPAYSLGSWARVGGGVGAAIAGAWLMLRVLHLLSPGTSLFSRASFTLLTFVLSPVFVCSVVWPGASIVTAIWLLAGCLAGLSRPTRARQRWLFVWVTVGIGMVIYGLIVARWQGWGTDNWLLHGWPGWVFPVSVLFHPAFCLPLPLLGAVFRRTDLYLPAKKILLVVLIIWGGLATVIEGRDAGALLGAYVVSLLLLFPSWDRFIAYGYYFLQKKKMHPVLLAILAIQLTSSLYCLLSLRVH